MIFPDSLITRLPGRAACARAIRPASSVTAASTCGPGSWPIRSGSGAGTCSGSRLSWTGCTIILPGRRFSCSLLPVTRVPGVKPETSTDRSSRTAIVPRVPGPPSACPPPAWSRSVDDVGTSRWPSPAARPAARRPRAGACAQHRQRPALERVTRPGQGHDSDRDHRRSPPAATGIPVASSVQHSVGDPGDVAFVQARQHGPPATLPRRRCSRPARDSAPPRPSTATCPPPARPPSPPSRRSPSPRHQ